MKASQRERLLEAMAELVGERGYEATTVPQVIAAARVSSNTFYGFFRDKADCFIALCEQLGDELFAQLVAARRPGGDVGDALAALDDGMAAYLRWFAERPALARAYFVELPTAGARAVEERERQFRRFQAILANISERARALNPETPPVRESELRAASIVSRELVAEEVRAGRVDRLEELHGELRYLLLKLLVGGAAAQRVEQAGPAAG